MTTAIPPGAARGARVATLAWQGWRMEIPESWNPVKIEGDYEKGFVLIADIDRPRLGVRWRTAGKKFDARRALRDELGSEAAEEAKSLEMPGERWGVSMFARKRGERAREVWIGHSLVSGRAIELVHHLHRSDEMLESAIVPTLVDQPADESIAWAVYGLSCVAPAGFRLASHSLFAGSVGLNFASRQRRVSIRQNSPAQLALHRMPLERWLAQREVSELKHYRRAGEPRRIDDATLTRRMTRRRRFCWMRWIAPDLFTYAYHDEPGDRLLIMQATEDATAKQALAAALKP